VPLGTITTEGLANFESLVALATPRLDRPILREVRLELELFRRSRQTPRLYPLPASARRVPRRPPWHRPATAGREPGRRFRVPVVSRKLDE